MKLGNSWSFLSCYTMNTLYFNTNSLFVSFVQTLKRSITELILLAFLLMNGMFLFACMIYVAEYQDAQSNFTDIPGGFWWSIITLTGVGYGTTRISIYNPKYIAQSNVRDYKYFISKMQYINFSFLYCAGDVVPKYAFMR